MQANHVTPAAIEQIVTTVWQEVLGLPLEPCTPAPSCSGTPDLSVCVHIAGAWNGAVLVWPNHQIALRAASLLFAISPSEVRHADIQDGMAELGNIVAGNLKSLLPGPSMLSLPTVTHGNQHEIFVRRTRLVADQAFLCEEQPLKVSVLQAIDSPVLPSGV